MIDAAHVRLHQVCHQHRNSALTVKPTRCCRLIATKSVAIMPASLAVTSERIR
jgi:hypothetical protein